MHKVKLTGILIKISEFGDSSLIYRFFTAEHALIGVLAKGIRKKAERQLLIPFSEYEICVYEPKEAGLWLLESAYLQRDYSVFPSSETWATAACGMELISQIIIPHDEHQSTYNLAISYLEYLCKTPNNAVLIFWRFFNRIIILSGIGNPISHCSMCHKETRSYKALLATAGGLVCPDCYPEIVLNENLIVLSSNSSIILQLLPEIANHLQEIQLTRKDVLDINTIFQSYWQAHHKHPLNLKSLSVLAQFYPVA